MLTQGRKAIPRFCFLGFLAVVIAFRCFFINGEEKQVERGHIGVQIRGKEQENRSPSQSQSHNIRVRDTGRQQVVLLAGPHKTASSSIQRNFFHWLNDDGHASGLSKEWAWPSPSQTFREDGCSVEGDFEEQQIFYWLIQALKGGGGSSKQIRCINSNVYTKLEMIEKYRNEIYNQWMEGYNLVIASEAMDFVSSERNRNPRRLLKRILDLLPWRGDHDHDHSESGSGHVPGSDDDITVVVNYRAPRSSHLISIWHECCMENMTFYEFLTDGRLDSGTSLDPLKSLDSLKLAKTFLDRGLEVILVDMSGVQANNFDISRVIACDVLGASCTPDKMFAVAGLDPQMKEYGSQTAMATATLTATATGTVSTNQKQHTEDNFNISHEVLGEVDAIIESYDCNFIDLMKNGNFTVLHEYKLKQIFQKCESETYNRYDRVTSREDMVQRIVNIAKEIKSKE